MPIYDQFGRPVDEQDPRTGTSLYAPPFPSGAGLPGQGMGPPPMPPGGPVPMGGPGGPPQQGGMAAALNSPGAAMLGQALNNTALMRRGGAPSQSPFDAYQRQVMAQANTRLAEEQNMRQQKILERGDPYYEYTEGKRRGILPEDMTWEQFQQAKYRALAGDTANIRDLNRIMELRRPKQEGETDEQYNSRLENATLLENLAQKPIVYSEGGESVNITSGVRPGQGALGAGSGGGAPTSPTQLVSPEVATANTAALAGSKEDATKWAGINADWQTGYQSTYPDVLNAAKKTSELISYIEQNKDMPTGMLQGHITPMTDQIVAYMDTLSTLLTIPSLKEAKLNPVTEQEFREIKSTFASAMKDPVANLGSLTATYNWLVGSLERMAEVQQHYIKNQTLKGFGAKVGAGDELPQRLPVPGEAPAQNINGTDLIEIPGL